MSLSRIRLLKQEILNVPLSVHTVFVADQNISTSIFFSFSTFVFFPSYFLLLFSALMSDFLLFAFSSSFSFHISILFVPFLLLLFVKCHLLTQSQLRAPKLLPGGRLRCQWPGCPSTRSFGRIADLQRHERNFHISPVTFKCTADGCTRSFKGRISCGSICGSFTLSNFRRKNRSVTSTLSKKETTASYLVFLCFLYFFSFPSLFLFQQPAGPSSW